MLELLWMREGSVGIVAVGAEFLYPPEGAASLPCRVSETENPFRVLPPIWGMCRAALSTQASAIKRRFHEGRCHHWLLPHRNREGDSRCAQPDTRHPHGRACAAEGGGAGADRARRGGGR